MSLINLVNRNNIILLTLIAIFSLEACATKGDDSSAEVKVRDLKACLINPELLVDVEEGAIEKELEIKYCSYEPADGEIAVIIVNVGSQTHRFWDINPIGAKIYSEYLFRKNGDLLLLVYGYDASNEAGYYFDYNLYRIGYPGVWRSGSLSDRIRLRNLLKNDPIRD